MNVLSIKNLSFKYPDNEVFILKDVNLTIEQKDFLGLVGGNGSGKSTLLKLILGLLSPIKGEVLLWGESPHKNIQKVGYISQYEDIDLNFPITMYELVLMGRTKKQLINKYSKNDKILVEKTMKQLGIWHLKNSLLAKVSGGQKQRGFLARALVGSPSLLILDEPLANLDIKLQLDFFEILKVLNKEITIIVVDHNLELLAKYSTKIICVDKCEPHSLKLHKDELKKLSSIHGHS